MVQFEMISELTGSGLLRLEDLEKIAGVLRRGGLCVLPTETGPMLAAVATNLAAVESAFRAKSRNPALPMHVACASLAMIQRISQPNPAALRILGKLTPGPVTVVVPQRDVLPDRLVTLGGTVGLRVPDSAPTLQVINAVGEPLTATSLNETGGPPILPVPQELQALRWPESEIVYVVTSPEAPSYTKPSTLVRVTESRIEVLREGPISEEMIRKHSRDTKECS